MNPCLMGRDQLYTGRAGESSKEKPFNKILSLRSSSTNQNAALVIDHLLDFTKLAVSDDWEVRANMSVYLRDVIYENRFHNCVGESEKALLVPVSKK